MFVPEMGTSFPTTLELTAAFLAGWAVATVASAVTWRLLGSYCGEVLRRAQEDVEQASSTSRTLARLLEEARDTMRRAEMTRLEK